MTKYQQRRKELLSELSALNEREQKEKDALEVPKARKKYLGKCFRFNNTVYSGQRECVYTLVLDVKNAYKMSAFQFTSLGAVYGIHEETNSALGKEISRAVFSEEYEKIYNSLENPFGYVKGE